MRAGELRSGVVPRGCSDGRMRSPEARGRDERDAVGRGEGKAAAVTDKGGEWIVEFTGGADGAWLS